MLLSPGNERTSDKYKGNIRKKKTQTINSLLLKWAKAYQQGGIVACRMPTFRNSVAFTCVATLGGPNDGNRGKHPSLLTHLSLVRPCHISLLASGTATADRGALLRKRLQELTLAQNLASYRAHPSVSPSKKYYCIPNTLPSAHITTIACLS